MLGAQSRGKRTKLTSPSSRRLAALLAGLLFGASLAPGEAWAQNDQDKAAARALATQGAQALAAHRYAEALDLVTRAEALLHAPTHQLMLARANAGLGRYVAAQEAYMKVIREELPANAPGAFKKAQQDASAELPAIEPKIASLRIVLDNAAGKKIAVKMDEQPVSEALVGVYRPVDPGKHEVTVLPVGGTMTKGSVQLGPGEKKELRLTVSNVTAPVGPPEGGAGGPGSNAGSKPGFFTPVRIAGFVVGGVGIGGVVAGGVFFSNLSATKADANQRYESAGCGKKPIDPKCTPQVRTSIQQLDNDAASQGTIAAIAFTTGGLAVIAGVTMIALGGAKSTPTTGFKVTPWVSPTGEAGLTGQF